MSFPRARIQRFNDVTSCAPAPGSYDPKYEDKVHGTVIERSERFNEPKAKGPDPQIISISGRSPSLNNLAVFRTPVNPKKKKASVSRQQKENITANNRDVKATLSMSDVDALKCALIEKEEELKSLELRLKIVVQQHAYEMSMIKEQNDIHVSLDQSSQAMNVEFKKEVDAYVCEQEGLNQEVCEPTDTAAILQVSELGEKSINVCSLEETVTTPQQDANISSTAHTLNTITQQMSTVDSIGIETMSTMSEENISVQDVLASVTESFDSLGINESNLDQQLNRNSEMIERLEAELSEKLSIVARLEKSHLDCALELIEAHTKTHDISSINQQLETRVKELDECVMTSNRNASHLKTRCLAFEHKANDREKSLMDLICVLADMELRHQQEFKNFAFETPELTHHICVTAEHIKSFGYQGLVTIENVKSFLTDLYKRRREIIRKLRETILHRDELRVLTIESQVTIVQLHDNIDQKSEDLNSLRDSYFLDLETYQNMIEYSKLECNKYKVSNANLHASLEAVSERLIKCHTEIEQLERVLATQSSENTALVDKVAEQSAALQAQNEQMICLEARNLHDIEMIHAELSSKVDVLQEKISRQADDYKSALLRNEMIFQSDCDMVQSKLVDISKMYTDVDNCNKNLRNKVSFLKGKLADSENRFSTYIEDNQPLYNLDSIRARSMKLRNEVLPEFEKYVNDMNVDEIKHVLKSDKGELIVKTVINDSMLMISSLMKLNIEREPLGPTIESLIRWYQEVELLSNFVTVDNNTKETAVSLARKETADLHLLLIQREATQELRKQIQLNEIGKKEIEQQLTAEISVKDSEISRLNMYLGEKEESYSQLCHQVTGLRNEVTESSQAVEDWKKRYMEIEALVGPFRQQLNEFESERLALESKKEAADSEVKHLAQKYAEILGHQNHKQKIRHVVQLKQYNLELKQNVNELESKLRQKNKAIEKLKEDLAAFHIKEKKAKEGLTRTIIPTPLGENSPHHQRHIQED